ncbi:hypothetical protein BpHYR1_049662 [Brachionus plicatilis]|uniref:Uncharacterized protein n=1 Tax=Brachionus plicatilis TaxID=10195 RepID=A0A3M7R5A9_BRAPC|nr:hypothetical protein BpHYR1_049662 [Brachionus plicatilis]
MRFQPFIPKIHHINAKNNPFNRSALIVTPLPQNTLKNWVYPINPIAPHPVNRSVYMGDTSDSGSVKIDLKSSYNVDVFVEGLAWVLDVLY